jgi:hypothetical protein
VDLILDIQSVVNWCEKGILTTGGSLVSSKSYWGLLDHQWNLIMVNLLQLIADTPGEIMIGKVDSEELKLFVASSQMRPLKLWGLCLIWKELTSRKWRI